MKLYTTTETERGKSVGKGGNKMLVNKLTLEIGGQRKEIGVLKATFDGKQYFVSVSLDNKKIDKVFTA